MKRKLSFLFVFFLLICSFGMVGCTSEKRVLGTWACQTEYGYYFFIIEEYGVITHKSQMNSQESFNTYSGTWIEIDKNEYSISIESSFTSRIYKLKDNKLTSDSSSAVYEKIDISIEEYVENLKNA